MLRTIGPVLVAAALLAGAIYVRNHQVDTVAAHQPLDIHGPFGAELTGRNVTGKVLSVRRTAALEVGSAQPIATDGTFVVVDFLATTIHSPDFIIVDLEIDDATHTPLDVPLAYRRDRVNPGIRLRATAVFEIDAAAAVDDAQIRIAASNDPRLDSRLVFDVELADMPQDPAVAVRPSEVEP